MDTFESRALDLPDFYFTGDDYKYRFEPEAKQRFLDLLRERFNAGVETKNRVLKWDTVVEQKAMMLGRYLLGRSDNLDFSGRPPSFPRTADKEICKQILRLSLRDALRLGIGKSTLHYLRRNANKEGSFTVYDKVRKKVGLFCTHEGTYTQGSTDDERWSLPSRKLLSIG
jgi:CRISPR-associated protein Cas1